MKDLKWIEEKDQRLFNRIANKYAKKDQYSVSKNARKFQILCLINLIQERFKITHFENILELGCGVGANSMYIKRFYDHYTGIDYSDEFIKIANTLYPDESTQFIYANIKDHSFKADNFDLIVGIGILHHLPDIKIVLQNLKKQRNKNALYGFLEVQSGNPVIQLLRVLRKRLDRDYSEDQNIFSRKFIYKTFQNEGFEIKEFLYQGYFSPPFAQVILKPKWLFLPIVKIAILLDKFIQKTCPSFLSWNMIFLAQIKE